uniref:Putative Erf family protein n=1 Tax=viral metagenome TaxID=1070528 RepID=A0A6H1ZFJ8_9ZZZZ
MANKKNTQIIVKENQPMPLIQMAIEKGASIEALEKLMNLQERWEANQAKKAFNEAMAGFQGECPIIKKKKDGGTTEGGKVAYKYAELGMIVSQVSPILQKYGLSYSFKTEFPVGKVKAICIAKHLLGHSEPTEVEMPLATKTKIMNDPQQTGATITYAKRYSFCNAFGIMTEGEDIDAQVGKSNDKKNEKPTIEETIEGIRKSKDEKTLLNVKKTIEESKNYTLPQKNVLLPAIEERLTELKNG